MAERLDADVIVIGGNPGGCCAAISAVRLGCRVLLLEATPTLGGMNANGTFGFDSAVPQAVSGVAREFGERIKAYYQRTKPDEPLLARRSDQVWESHVAAAIWSEMLGEHPGIEVRLGAVATGIVMSGRYIQAIEWQPAEDPFGNVSARLEPSLAAGKMFVDAAYEGDVTAWSGAPFRIGREARSREEPHAGVIFTNNLGGFADGHLPQSILPGSTGAADDAIAAFAFRLHCRLYDDTSPHAPHRLRSPPDNYSAENYRWEPVAQTRDGSPIHFNSLYVLVGGRVLLNRMVHGNNLAAPARAYILAYPYERAPLRKLFLDHSLGFLYYIQTEGGMPGLGLAHDDFSDNGNVPYMVYVREGRRIEGHAILTQADIDPFIKGDGYRPPPKPDSIAVADWLVESQGCRDEISEGYPFPEGFIFSRVPQAPFQIPYGCLLPQKVENLVVAGSISATHVAYTAIRCEAARMQVGIAAGIAAALAHARCCAPAEIAVSDVQAEIVHNNGQLTFFRDVDGSHAHFSSVQWAALRGLVPHDSRWRFFPDQLADWAWFVTAAVKCLDIPISVSGDHFEDIPPGMPCFRYFETLYDLGTRCGIDMFDMRSVRVEDPMVDFLKLHRGSKRIALVPDDVVDGGTAAALLDRIVACLAGGQGPVARKSQPGTLTRAGACALLEGAAVPC